MTNFPLFDLPAPTALVSRPAKNSSGLSPAPAGSLQGELDLAGKALETIWNSRVQEHAAKQTEEVRCLRWLGNGVAPSDGDWAWWRSLPRYERERWLCDYSDMRERIEHGLPFRRAAYYHANREANWAQMKALAQHWSGDIRKAFREGRPSPIIPPPPFEIALDMAIDLAGVPKACVAQPHLEEEAA